MRNSLHSILCFCQAFERKLNKSKHPNSSGKLASSSLPEHLYRRFSLYEIRAATNNFDSDLVLGKGGTAVVYKGFFDDGASVLSVKRLMLGSSRHKILEDFRNEVELLCQLRHEHLVSLIGFCDEEDENIIVLSYMNQGSLFHHLHGTHHDPLTWKKRLEICVGVARGLHYLHAGAKRALSCVHVREHKRPDLGEVEATLELDLELQNRADSEMECLNPHGEVMYEEVVVSASAFNFLDYEADVFWPHGSSRLDSFIVEDSFSGKTEDTLSDIEGFYT